MTAEQLRNMIVEECNNILNLPRFRWLLTTEQRKVVLAQRNYWANAGSEQLEILLAQYNQIRSSTMVGQFAKVQGNQAILNLSEDQKKQVAERLQSEVNYAIDWDKIPFDKILLVLKFIIQVFFADEPQPVFGHPHDGDVVAASHEMLCAACCNMCAAQCLHEAVCGEHD